MKWNGIMKWNEMKINPDLSWNCQLIKDSMWAGSMSCRNRNDHLCFSGDFYNITVRKKKKKSLYNNNQCTKEKKKTMK